MFMKPTIQIHLRSYHLVHFVFTFFMMTYSFSDDFKELVLERLCYERFLFRKYWPHNCFLPPEIYLRELKKIKR